MSNPPASRRRQLTLWSLSVVGALVLGWLASRRLPLWPEAWASVDWSWMGLALALYLPYAYARAERIRLLIAPVLDAPHKLSSALVHGSGLVSFFLVMLLPLRLGEFTRPAILARHKLPGLGFSEGLGAQASEKIVDGLVVVGLLFGGLALADPASLGRADPELLEQVSFVGSIAAGVFGVGLLVLFVVARRPEPFVTLIRRLAPEKIGERLGSIVERIAGALAPLFNWRTGVGFALWTLLYWLVTLIQLWALARAFGLDFGIAGAAAVVAIVGLSIQLPGGPAQLGSFQVGMASALLLFVDPSQLESAGASFSVAMYLVQFVGAGVAALLGLGLLRRAKAASDVS